MTRIAHHTSESERMNELLQQLTEEWCCLVCYAKFEAGDLTSSAFDCPFCRSPYIHPINRGPIVLDRYNGPIGPVH